MNFRKAKTQDIDRILEIYSESREFMRSAGNLYQWAGGYPGREVIEDDIANGNFYILEDGCEIAAVFAMLDGPDETYLIIKDGQWLNSEPYGVIHRIAVAKKGKGIVSECFRFAFEKYGNVRIDTHKDNIPMQKALIKNGFSYCGVIFLKNGDERIAFQKI